jgi:hypothetical protein
MFRPSYGTVLAVVASSSLSAAISALVVLSVALPAVVAAQAERELAGAYVLADPANADWGALEIGRNPQGQPVPSLRLNQNGALRVRMEAGRNSPESAALTLRDQTEQVRIRLALASSLTPGTAGDLNAIDVLDQNQRVRVHIGVEADGTPFLQLLDADGQVTWSAT